MMEGTIREDTGPHSGFIDFVGCGELILLNDLAGCVSHIHQDGRPGSATNHRNYEKVLREKARRLMGVRERFGEVRRGGWPHEGAIPGFEGRSPREGAGEGSYRTGCRERVKGLGVVGEGGAGVDVTAGVPAGLVSAGWLLVAAVPRSGRDTSEPGTNVWR
jgi:hypothetical protein